MRRIIGGCVLLMLGLNGCIQTPDVGLGQVDHYTRTMQTLSQGTPAERAKAAETLGYCPPERKVEVVAALTQALARDRDGEVRFRAVVALLKHKEDARSAEAQMRHALNDSHGMVVINAAVALSSLGADRKDLIPPVRKVLSDPLAWRRIQAASVLRQLGLAPDELVPVLTDALADEKAEVRRQALHTLARFRNLPRDTLPLVAGVLRDDADEQVRYKAVLALWDGYSSAPVDVVPVLIKAMGDSYGHTRRVAGMLLGRCGQDAHEALPGLATLSRDPEDYLIRSHALAAMVQIAPADPEVLSVLIKALGNDAHFRVREAAARSLGRTGSQLAEVLAALKKAESGDEKEEVRKAAAHAIKSLNR